MDTYQFVASIVESATSLAWPAALFGAGLVFRRELSSLLPLLQLKHKDFEVSFRLTQAEIDAANLPAPIAPVIEPTPEEKDKFDRLVEISPRAAILEVRTDLEEAVRDLASVTQMAPTKSKSLLTLTRILRNDGLIDSQTSALLDDLRVIGNRAAHDPYTELGEEEARRFRTLANQVMNILNK